MTNSVCCQYLESGYKEQEKTKGPIYWKTIIIIEYQGHINKIYQYAATERTKRGFRSQKILIASLLRHKTSDVFTKNK